MSASKVYLGKITGSSLQEKSAVLLHSNSKEPLRITFEDSRSALLDVSRPRSAAWAKMIARAQRDDQPVYLEVAQHSDMIIGLCIPIATEVLDISSASNGTIYIALSASDALHSLHRDTAGFDELYRALRHAKDSGSAIMVTATLHHADIIDARPLPQYFIKGPFDPLPDPEPVTPVSLERCKELFHMVSVETCEIGSMKTPCIPYKYPFSGCNVRAHLMCYMMRAAGATPEKMWISGGLHARSPNAPDCEVGWGWHVAPTLLVSQPTGDPVKMVLDPSLCQEPVSVEYWKSLQGNPNATLTPMQWDGYNFLGRGTATQAEADEEMEKYREWLAYLWVERPPPYKCPKHK